MNQILRLELNLISKVNFCLISLLPLSLVTGSLVSNSIVVLICLLFLIDVIIKKNAFFLNEKNFYFLIIINIYLILNSYFLSEYDLALLKSIGFLRFIILAYALAYYFKIYQKKILKIWFLFFILVSFDILFEYFNGFNILGFKAIYPGRIASFTGDELKIGGFYFGFIMLALSYLEGFKNRLFLLCAIVFFIISLLIGERSNFLKIFFMYILFFIFFYKETILKKIFFIVTFVFISSIIIFNSGSLKNKFYNQIYIKILNSKNNEDNLSQIIKKNQHFSHYYVASKILRDNLFFGSGFKTFRLESHKPKYQKEVYGSSTHPHQIHFEILSELGLVGYILILSNLIILIINNFKTKINNYKKGAILFILASILPFLPSGSFFTSYGALIFFINYSFLIRSKDLNDINFSKLNEKKSST